MGYDNNFLKTRINAPVLNDVNSAFLLNGSEVIDYTHFSLALSKPRKFAIWVAWNIDGSNLKRISRDGIDFYEDCRIPENSQAGNKLYSGNPLDRGHIARRADLVWGDFGEAKRANEESFVFTNIAPQMDSFNQSHKGGVWGDLEISIYDQVKMDRSRVSIIGGCIFNNSDREYRDFKIPVEFFKTISYEENHIFKTKSFILTQDLSQLRFLDLEEFKTYEVGPMEIEEKCSFKFDSAIHKANKFDMQKNRFNERQPIQDVSEIYW